MGCDDTIMTLRYVNSLTKKEMQFQSAVHKQQLKKPNKKYHQNQTDIELAAQKPTSYNLSVLISNRSSHDMKKRHILTVESCPRYYNRIQYYMNYYKRKRYCKSKDRNQEASTLVLTEDCRSVFFTI